MKHIVIRRTLMPASAEITPGLGVPAVTYCSRLPLSLPLLPCARGPPALELEAADLYTHGSRYPLATARTAPIVFKSGWGMGCSSYEEWIQGAMSTYIRRRPRAKICYDCVHALQEWFRRLSKQRRLWFRLHCVYALQSWFRQLSKQRRLCTVVYATPVVV